MIHKTLASIIRHPLNRHSRIQAIFRFIKWQIGTRLLQSSVIIPWINDSRLVVARGDHGLTFNIYCGLQEFMEMSFCLHFLRPRDVFFDVGANFGSYTVLASAVAGANTHSFEPVSSSYARLMENIRINKVDTLVSSHNIGLAAEDTNLRFSIDQNCTNHVVKDSDASNMKTQIQTVKRADSFAGEQAPALMKIDVEGYETEVLQGSQKILESNNLKAIIIELNGSGRVYGKDDAQIVMLLLDKGFIEYTYCPFSRKLSKTTQAAMNDNRLFIRDIAYVSDRVSQAPKFKVLGQEL